MAMKMVYNKLLDNDQTQELKEYIEEISYPLSEKDNLTTTSVIELIN